MYGYTPLACTSANGLQGHYHREIGPHPADNVSLQAVLSIVRQKQSEAL